MTNRKIKHRWRNDKLRRVQIYLPDGMIAALDDAADKVYLTRSEVIRRCVTQFLTKIEG